MPDDDRRRAREERLRGSHRVVDHRPPGDVVQHLGARGFHSRALAGGQNDDVEVRHRLTSLPSTAKPAAGQAQAFYCKPLNLNEIRSYRRRSGFRRSVFGGLVASSAARTLSNSRSGSRSGSWRARVRLSGFSSMARSRSGTASSRASRNASTDASM